MSWWACDHQARHFARGNSTQILPTFDLAQALQVTECVEGYSVRRTPSEHPYSRLPGRTVHDSRERRLCHSRATELGYRRLQITHRGAAAPHLSIFVIFFSRTHMLHPNVKVPPLVVARPLFEASFSLYSSGQKKKITNSFPITFQISAQQHYTSSYTSCYTLLFVLCLCNVLCNVWLCNVLCNVCCVMVVLCMVV